MRWARHSRDERGFTLIELCITIVILTMITGALAAAFVTALNSTRSNAENVRKSNDAQLIAGFLVRDAQSAGGTDPSTAAADASIGVSTQDAAGCTGPQSLVVRFSWIDRVSSGDPITRVATYFHAPAPANEVVRETCADGVPESTLTLGNEIEAAAATCNNGFACSDNLPDTVELTLTSTTPDNAAAITYRLTASVRPQSQTPPAATSTRCRRSSNRRHSLIGRSTATTRAPR